MTCEEFLRAVIISLKDDNDQGIVIDETLYGGHKLCDGDLFGEIIPWKILYVENSDYNLSLEDSYGGEGKGDEYWYVFKIVIKKTNEVKYVKFEGFYDSWNGVSWDDFPIFVEPREKVIRVWNTVKE